MRRSLFVLIAAVALCFPSCHSSRPAKITVGSKFFTEQVILAELLAQHIEARTGIPVVRKTNLGGTLLVHKALEAGDLDLYVEYTGTALTAVLNETPSGDSSSVYNRVKQLYSDRFHFEVTEPLGFENTFAMVVRGDDAKNLHLRTISDIALIAPKWRAGVGYEFLERPEGSVRPPLRRAAPRDGPRPHLPRPPRSPSRHCRRQFHGRPHRRPRPCRARRQPPLLSALRRRPRRSPVHSRPLPSASLRPR